MLSHSQRRRKCKRLAGVCCRDCTYLPPNVLADLDRFVDSAFDDINVQKQDMKFLFCVPPLPLVKVFV